MRAFLDTEKGRCPAVPKMQNGVLGWGKMIKVNKPKKIKNKREIEFVNSYPNGGSLLYEHKTFSLVEFKTYTPDFYDVKRGVYIEVSGTRAAYSAGRMKYAEFKRLYPMIQFEVRNPDGSEFKILRKPTGDTKRRTNVHITDEQKEKLLEYSKMTGFKPAELVRKFIDEGLKKWVKK